MRESSGYPKSYRCHPSNNARAERHNSKLSLGIYGMEEALFRGVPFVSQHINRTITTTVGPSLRYLTRCLLLNGTMSFGIYVVVNALASFLIFPLTLKFQRHSLNQCR
jgi:hypothetical protein